GARSVERLPRDGVGEGRQGPAPVDLTLGPLGLELVQDARQLGHLPLVQLQLVGEKTEGATDAEGAPAEPISIVLTSAVARPMPVRCPAAPAPRRPSERSDRIEVALTTTMPAAMPPAMHSMHSVHF